ncbi:MAG TPA: PQQ-binding-like beta-propeller repeat protein [Anaerolineales bacterium]|nr:PQQ-binding-like beta-propeller repeat protein [Anaerolineales bacterium]
MNLIRRRLLMCSLLAAGFLLPPALPSPAADKREMRSDLIWEWATGSIKTRLPERSIEVTDLDGDGATDMVVCQQGYVTNLNFVPPAAYAPAWFSVYMRCTAIATGDRNGDGAREIYALVDPGRVVILDASGRAELGAFDLPAGVVSYDLAVADVDGDTHSEIVVSLRDRTLVYDAATFALEWSAIGHGAGSAHNGGVLIANIDGDALLEIVVNGDAGHILNAALQTEEFGIAGGLGKDFDLSDVDSDGMAEIVYGESTQLYILDADTLSVKWQRGDLPMAYSVVAVDLDGNGETEIVHGDGNVVRGLNGANGATLWTWDTPRNETEGLVAGDLDSDGLVELGWAAPSVGALYIGDWQSQTVDWESWDYTGTFLAETGDVDADGEGEILVAPRSGDLLAYAGSSHDLLWSKVDDPGLYHTSFLELGQVDDDSALEILTANYSTLSAFDGATGMREWAYHVFSSSDPAGLAVANLDSDPQDEIVIGTTAGHVLVLDSDGSTVLWDSGAQPGSIIDFSLGDLNGDGVLDLAVLTAQVLRVFTTDTWELTQDVPFTDGVAIAVANGDGRNAGELITARYAGSYLHTLQAWNGIDLQPIWQESLSVGSVEEIDVADLDSDGVQEFLVMGVFRYDVIAHPSSYLRIGALYHDPVWEYQLPDNWETVYGSAAFDLDNDSRLELVLGAHATVQVYEVTGWPVYYLFTPFVTR